MFNLEYDIDELYRLSLPARMTCTAISLLTPIGCDTMIENLPQEYFIAVVLTAIAVGAIFLVIMYLCQYEEWKANTLTAYIERLNSVGAPAMDDKPDTAFSKV